MITDNKEVIIMSEVTAPIMTDATGQSIDSKLNSLLGKMDNLAAAFQPNASGIVYSNTTSGLTGDDVQEAIDEMAADVSEIKSSLSQLDIDLTMSDNSTSHLNKFGRVVTIEYYNNTNTTKAGVTGQLPSGAFDGRIRQLKFANTSIYINELGAFAIDANGWARLTATFVLNS